MRAETRRRAVVFFIFDGFLKNSLEKVILGRRMIIVPGHNDIIVYSGSFPSKYFPIMLKL